MNSERPSRRRVCDKCSTSAPGETRSVDLSLRCSPHAQRFNKRGLLNQRSPIAGRKSEKGKPRKLVCPICGRESLVDHNPKEVREVEDEASRKHAQKHSSARVTEVGQEQSQRSWAEPGEAWEEKGSVF